MKFNIGIAASLAGYLIVLITALYNEPVIFVFASFSRTGQTMVLLFFGLVAAYLILLFSGKKNLFGLINSFLLGFIMQVVLILCISFPATVVVSEILKSDLLKNALAVDIVTIGMVFLIEAVSFYCAVKKVPRKKTVAVLLILGAILACLLGTIIFSVNPSSKYIFPIALVVFFAPLLSLIKSDITSNPASH
jgi:hypothetical protein